MDGHLINIFTNCNYTTAVDLSSQPPSTDMVTKIRDAEDKVFADKCGLTTHNLHLSEATVLGFSPFDLGEIEHEVELLDNRLVPFLLEIIKKQKKSNVQIYCPLAIGRHRNHISVFMSIVRAYETLGTISKIYFYEDLPYASQIESRKEAIKRLAYYFQQSGMSRHANQLTHEEMNKKLEFISLYQSQHAGPVARQHFFPAEPLTPFPHEAFWEVTDETIRHQP